MLEFNDKSVLKTTVSISHKQMEEKVKLVYEVYDNNRRKFEAKQADLEDLKQLEDKLKKNIKRN